MVDQSDLRDLTTRLARQRQADILLYSGELARPGDGPLALGRLDGLRRPTCLLVLRTLGGSADEGLFLTRLEPAISDRRTRVRLLPLDDAMAIVESPEQARAQRPDDGRVATRDVGNP